MPSVPGQDNQQWQQYAGYDYQSYYAAWQNYQSQQYYGGYDQNYANYGNAYYQQQTPYPAYQQPYPAPPYPPPVEDASQVAAATQEPQADPNAAAQYYGSSTYETAETITEEHDVPLNKEMLNLETINKSEDLYDAMDESRWLPIAGLDPPYVKIKERNL